MNKQDHAQALLGSARDALPKIEDLYNGSLAEKELDSQLLIQIKNLLENLRSALDYVARDVFERFCTPPEGGKTIPVYFPILRRTATPQDFSNFANGRFPGLRENARTLYDCLESYQVYKSPENEWLVQFNELCQENKHEHLSPQTRREEKQTQFSDKSGGSVSWNEGVYFGPGGRIVFKPGGKLSFGRGGSVGFGKSGVRIMGRPVDPQAQAPVPDPESALRRVVWVDFRFDALGVSAFPFLRTCLAKVAGIMEAVRGAADEMKKEMG